MVNGVHICRLYVSMQSMRLMLPSCGKVFFGKRLSIARRDMQIFGSKNKSMHNI